MDAQHAHVPVFILAGGFGTRLSEETHLIPKPMIEVGGIPIITHIMRWYYHHGFNDFVVCAGYKSWVIKQYFLQYDFRQNHVAIDARASSTPAVSVVDRDESNHENWRVRIFDTGDDAMTGARVARAYDLAYAAEPFDHFAVTYGDGVCDVNLAEEFAFHREMGKVGTVIGVSPPARFGKMEFSDDLLVRGFSEKPPNIGGGINGGYFFFDAKFRKYLSDDASLVLERQPLESLARDRQLAIFVHKGFWQCMDTLREKKRLQEIWDSGAAPWKAG